MGAGAVALSDALGVAGIGGVLFIAVVAAQAIRTRLLRDIVLAFVASGAVGCALLRVALPVF